MGFFKLGDLFAGRKNRLPKDDPSAQKRFSYPGNRNPFNDYFFGINADYTRFEVSPEGLKDAYYASVWVYRCVQARSKTVASVPLYVKTLDDEYVDREGRPTRERPTSIVQQHVLQTFLGAGKSRLMRQTEADFCIWGTGYWEPTRNGLFRLNPSTMQVMRQPGSGIEKFVQNVGGHQAEWEPDELIYFYDYDPGEDVGSVSPLQYAVKSLAVDINVAEYIRAYFVNDATPSGLLMSDQTISEPEVRMISEWWERMFRGTGNRHKVGVVGGGLRFEPISASPGELAFTDIRAEMRREICAAMGVPQTIAMADEAANYSTSREQHQSFYTETIIPQLDMYLDTINEQLVPLFEGGEHLKVVADISGITVLQELRSELMNQVTSGFQAGLYSMNEARSFAGLPPLETDLFLVNGELKKKEDLGKPSAQDDGGGFGGDFGGGFGGASAEPPAEPEPPAPPEQPEEPPTPDEDATEDDDLPWGKLPAHLMDSDDDTIYDEDDVEADPEPLADQSPRPSRRYPVSPSPAFVSRRSLPEDRRMYATQQRRARRQAAAIKGQVTAAEEGEDEPSSAFHQQAAIDDMRRWKRKALAQGPSTAFHSRDIPSAHREWVAWDLEGIDPDDPQAAEKIRKAFDVGLAGLKAKGETPAQFQAYWRGVIRIGREMQSIIQEMLRDRTLQQAALTTADAQGNLQVPADVQKATLERWVDRLVGTPEVPGPLARLFIAGASRGQNLIDKVRGLFGQRLPAPKLPPAGQPSRGGVSVAWDLINRQAYAFARQYAYELVKGMNQTTMQAFQVSTSNWIERGGSLSSLREAIQKDLQNITVPEGWSDRKIRWAQSPARAQLIAQTESTRVFAEGNQARWRQLGVQTARYRTQNDTLVCDLCKALNNSDGSLQDGFRAPTPFLSDSRYRRLIKNGFVRLPVHPGCRCFHIPVVDSIQQQADAPEVSARRPGGKLAIGDSGRKSALRAYKVKKIVIDLSYDCDSNEEAA